MPSNARSHKSYSVKTNITLLNKFDTAQTEVWSDVADISSQYKVNSNTANLSDVYESQKSHLDELSRKHKLDKSSNGVAFYSNNKLISLDILNSTSLYCAHFYKLLNSAILSTMHFFNFNPPSQIKALGKLARILNKISTTDKSVYNSPGVGADSRFETKNFHGFELTYESNLIHLSIQRKC